MGMKELRHTTGSLMHLKGSPVLAIKDQLRHTTSRTTESFYIGSDLDYQRQQVHAYRGTRELIGNGAAHDPMDDVGVGEVDVLGR